MHLQFLIPCSTGHQVELYSPHGSAVAVPQVDFTRRAQFARESLPAAAPEALDEDQENGDSPHNGRGRRKQKGRGKGNRRSKGKGRGRGKGSGKGKGRGRGKGKGCGKEKGDGKGRKKRTNVKDCEAEETGEEKDTKTAKPKGKGRKKPGLEAAKAPSPSSHCKRPRRKATPSSTHDVPSGASAPSKRKRVRHEGDDKSFARRPRPAREGPSQWRWFALRDAFQSVVAGHLSAPSKEED